MLSYEIYCYNSIMSVILYMTIIYISITWAITYDRSTLCHTNSACPVMRSYHWDGMEDGHRSGHWLCQPDGWKITSVDPNVKEFLSKGGSLGSYIRSLWPQQLAPDRSDVVWFSLRSLWPEQPVTGDLKLAH